MTSNQTFTASNGHTVGVDKHGDLLFRDDIGGEGNWLFGSHVSLAAEYFQHVRDDELGRWRNPDRPNEVVYPRDNGDILVLDEVDGRRLGWTREEALNEVFVSSLGIESARAYFAAHPEPDPKPWEEAKPGEVWLLTTDGVDEPWTVLHAGYMLFWSPTKFGSRNMGLTNPGITAGRRIWPVDAEGDGDE